MRYGSELLLKVNWYNRSLLVRLTLYLIMFLPRLDLLCAGPLALWEFSLQSPVNVGETKKNSWAHHLNAGLPGIGPFGKSGRGYCIMFIKRLDKCLRLQFFRQNSLFLPGYSLHLNWLAKILN